MLPPLLARPLETTNGNCSSWISGLIYTVSGVLAVFRCLCCNLTAHRRNFPNMLRASVKFGACYQSSHHSSIRGSLPLPPRFVPGFFMQSFALPLFPYGHCLSPSSWSPIFRRRNRTLNQENHDRNKSFYSHRYHRAKGRTCEIKGPKEGLER